MRIVGPALCPIPKCGRGLYGWRMAQPTPYRWLRIAGFATLALAALMVMLAVRHHEEERRSREDVGARAAEIMNRIEAEANRIEAEAAKP